MCIKKKPPTNERIYRELWVLNHLLASLLLAKISEDDPATADILLQDIKDIRAGKPLPKYPLPGDTTE